MLKRVLGAVLGTILISASLLSVTAGTAQASTPVPPVTKKLAKQMSCKYPHKQGLAGGGQNIGVLCRVKNSKGRQNIYVLKYKNLDRAIDFWREWTEAWDEEDEPGCIARKGKILIIPMGGGSGVDDNAYTPKWCKYAANRTDGRVIYGYPA
jgi:hypothetical protein